MSDPYSILKGEINRLGFVSDEKISLFGFFTGNEKNQADALSSLNDFDADNEKRNYLRSLIPPRGMFSQILLMCIFANNTEYLHNRVFFSASHRQTRPKR
jgi:hypothetical protein